MLIAADATLKLLDELFSPLGTVRRIPGREISRTTIAHADALVVRSITRVDGALLEGSRVKWVGTASAGFDNIHRSDLEQLGIAWNRAPGCNAAAVADHVVCICAEALSSGVLSRGDLVGVIGVGEVGKRVEQRLPGLGLVPLPFDPPRARAEANPALADLEKLHTAAMITLHVPLIRSGEDPSAELVTAAWLSRFPRLKLLVNTSRGGVVREPDLIKAIDNGLTVALDVWNGEPHINPELVKRVRWATPHIAGHSRMGKLRGSIMLRQAFDRWRNSESSVDEQHWKEQREFDATGMTDPIEWINSLSWLADDDRAFREALDSTKRTGGSRDGSLPFDHLRDHYLPRIEFSEIALRGITDPALRQSATTLGFSLAL